MPQVINVYNLAAAGGAPLIIRCTRVTSRMEIIEDGSANGGFQQGLIGQQLTPVGFGVNTVGSTFNVAPNVDDEPLVFAGYSGDTEPHTVPIGNGGSGTDRLGNPQPVSPGGPATLGTAIVQLTSASANTTKVRVTEWF